MEVAQKLGCRSGFELERLGFARHFRRCAWLCVAQLHGGGLLSADQEGHEEEEGVAAFIEENRLSGPGEQDIATRGTESLFSIWKRSPVGEEYGRNMHNARAVLVNHAFVVVELGVYMQEAIKQGNNTSEGLTRNICESCGSLLTKEDFQRYKLAFECVACCTPPHYRKC